MTYTVYKHVCQTNGKVYVGLTSKTMMKRWQQHCVSSCNGSDAYFHRAIRAHGIECWIHCILHENIIDLETARSLESDEIAKHKSCHQDFGYNLTKGGEFVVVNDELRQKRSRARLRCNEQIAAKLRGRKRSPEVGEKISQILTGKKLSDEHKNKIREANTGYVPTQATRDKIRQLHSGRKRNPETGKRIGNALRGFKHSEESKRNMRLARQGVKTTHEEKLKRRSEKAKEKLRLRREASA